MMVVIVLSLSSKSSLLFAFFIHVVGGSVLILLDRIPTFGQQLFINPIPNLINLDSALIHAQSRILSTFSPEEAREMRIHRRIHTRLQALPLHPTIIFDRIPGGEVEGRLIAVRGTVTRVGSLKMQDIRKIFQCTKCGITKDMPADDRQFGMVAKPPVCTHVADEQRCGGTKFIMVEANPKHPDTIKNGNFLLDDINLVNNKEDYQEIRIQENTSLLAVGAVPRSMTIILKHDLVDCCKAGDNVTIVGWIITRWKPVRVGQIPELEFALVANNILQRTRALIHGNNLSEEEGGQQLVRGFWNDHGQELWHGRSILVESFCSQIHGMHLVKLAVLLTVIGGCNPNAQPCSLEVESEVLAGEKARLLRREGHLLLVGDPGTAKSQFLVAASRILHRSVQTTGSGSTNAGLTVAAVKEAGSWQLEAGALVLSDGGICCIDEFNSLRPHDRTAIHEAMEQQTLSVAKAGLVCKLSTRCSVLAACNARGGDFEEGQSISSNVALASPLLSRFDLILVLNDRKSRAWDEQLSNAILQAAIQQRGHHPRNGSRPNNPIQRLLDWDQLRTYINHVRNHLNPTMSLGARLILGKYYQKQRRADSRDAARTTIRMLESLVRLAQAHAKLLGQTSVELRDAVWAVVLMETSLATHTLLNKRPDLYDAAPPEPARQYEEYEELVLSRLDINRRIITEMGMKIDLPAMETDIEAQRLLGSWATTQSVHRVDH